MVSRVRNFFQNRRHCIAVVCTIAILCITFAGITIYNILENRRIDAEALSLKDDLTVDFGRDAKASDFIAELKGEMISDMKIDTTKLGEQEVSLEFYNIKHKKRARSFMVEVVDRTQPVIYGGDFYTISTNYEGNLVDLMLSGDNADDNPRREVIGDYDLTNVGDYEVEYVITDASGNSARQPFTLRVVAPSKNSAPQNNKGNVAVSGLPIAEVISAHKNDTTRIGIDVSSWQGEIDWQKVKAAGVEFVMIRVGYQVSFGDEYKLDKHFIDNIEGATGVGLPVGVYFYSCANSADEAKRQAEWVTEQIRDYRVELGVSFDWEEWRNFNKAGMSFYTLNQVAKTFIDTVTAEGYEGILYGSKNHIEKFWQGDSYKLWLAQYYNRVTYEGEYYIWQLSDTGAVPGISGYVDLDVMYLADD